MTLAGRHLLLLGDSWVAGAAGAALADVLAGLGATVVRDGVVGAGAISTVARLRDVLDEAQGFDTILLLLGVNDVASQRVRDAYVTLREALSATGANVYVVSNATISDPTLPYRTKVRTIEVWQRDVFGDHALALSSSADDAWFDRSHFHLTAEAAPLWVARITPSVLALLDDSPLATLGRALLRTVPGGTTSFARLA
jgi:lysophospholipase L1-like esterase